MPKRESARWRHGTRVARHERSTPLPGDLWVLIFASHLILAFLCVLPFTRAFHGLPTGERGVYLTARIAAGTGVLLFLLPPLRPVLVRWLGDRIGRLLVVPRLVLAGRVALTLAVVLTTDAVVHTIAGQAMGVLASLGAAAIIGLSAPSTTVNDGE